MRLLFNVLFVIIVFNFSVTSHANFCQDRSVKILELQKQYPFEAGLSEFKQQSPTLLVLGEPHQSYVLEQLPMVLDLLTEEINCAFVEFPFDVPESDFVKLIKRQKTDYFREETSFDYIPFIQWLVDKGVKIIPVDDPIVKVQQKRKNILSWMLQRDQTMFDGIMKNMGGCKKSVFLVGKSHLTSGVSGYNKSLGHKLKEKLKNKVSIVDLTVPRNFLEPYCSAQENKLFTKKSFIPTKNLTDVEYSSLVSNSFWSDFDWSLYLPEH